MGFSHLATGTVLISTSNTEQKEQLTVCVCYLTAGFHFTSLLRLLFVTLDEMTAIKSKLHNNLVPYVRLDDEEPLSIVL